MKILVTVLIIAWDVTSTVVDAISVSFICTDANRRYVVVWTGLQ